MFPKLVSADSLSSDLKHSNSLSVPNLLRHNFPQGPGNQLFISCLPPQMPQAARKCHSIALASGELCHPVSESFAVCNYCSVLANNRVEPGASCVSDKYSTTELSFFLLCILRLGQPCNPDWPAVLLPLPLQLLRWPLWLNFYSGCLTHATFKNLLFVCSFDCLMCTRLLPKGVLCTICMQCLRDQMRVSYSSKTGVVDTYYPRRGEGNQALCFQPLRHHSSFLLII